MARPGSTLVIVVTAACLGWVGIIAIAVWAWLDLVS